MMGVVITKDLSGFINIMIGYFVGIITLAKELLD